MCYQAVCGGTVAAAVVGTVTTGGATPAVRSGRATALALSHELARTGASTTELLVVVGLLLFFAGVLLVGLTRRHGVSMKGRLTLAPPGRGGGGAPLPV